MRQYERLLDRIKASENIKRTSFVVDPSPLEFFEPEETIEFHASRLLFLLRFCGSELEEGSAIKGRTKLAKLDFFLRYPIYLNKALQKLGREDIALHLEEHETQSIEATMIRYKYGPWDKKYYDVFAYLIAKGLMVIVYKGGIDHFVLTPGGEVVVEMLLQQDVYRELVNRCRVIKKALGKRSGKSLKEFIYRNFPEIVRQPVGSIIEGMYHV